MSSRQYLINTSTKHQVFLLRYAGGIYNKMLKFIEKSRKESVRLIKNANTDWSKARFERFNTQLEQLNVTIYQAMSKQVLGNMTDLAKYESGVAGNTIKKAIKLDVNLSAPTVPQLQAAAFTSIVDSVPGVDKKSKLTVGKALEQFGKTKTTEIVSVARVGFALAKSNKETAQDISDKVTSVTMRQAKALSRTITNHVASSARGEFYKQNSELFTGYQVVATLDDRTSFTCGALDGQVFDEGEFEYPPYHWNCRSTYIPVLDKKYDLGSEIGGQRPSKNEDGVELVDTKTTYNSWLKQQSPEFQNEVLGTKRAELFRAGMSVDKFVDHNYRPLSLDQLHSTDNEHLFKKAGL